MKKDTVRGIIAAVVLLALYLVLVFAIPFEKTAVYWLSFAFTLVAFAVAGAAVYMAFLRREDTKSRFYGFPIVRIGVVYALLQLVVGLLFMLLGAWIPVWIAVIVYAVGLGAAVLGLIGTEAVAEEVIAQDAKLKKDVSVMRALQSKVNQMAGQCADPNAADAVKKLAEEFRYSDPVSSEALTMAEMELASAVGELQTAVTAGDGTAAVQLCRKASAVLAGRNRLC